MRVVQPLIAPSLQITIRTLLDLSFLQKMSSVPELIAPWGSYTKAMVAAHNGAEAVYLGVPFTSLRMRQNHVRDYKILQQTIDDLHAFGVKAYLTMNIFPRNMDIKIFESVLEKIASMNADAIIFSDPWTFRLIRKHFPDIRLHLSTQANTLNHEAISFRHDLWVERVVLARELTIKEIAQIKQKVPAMELEIFVHGAMCIAYSWRCLMGEYFSGRDGNKGECSHVCRYNFKVHLEEQKRPWRMFELGQDEEGTYLMSSKDLCTIERLAELLPYVDGLKIEGRSKSELYVGAVTSAYRYVRDRIMKNEAVNDTIKNRVYQIPHRPYRDGFLFNDIRSAPDGEPLSSEEQHHLHDPENIGVTKTSPWPVAQVEFCGVVLPKTANIDWKKFHVFTPKQKLVVGDQLHAVHWEQTILFTITALSADWATLCEHVTNNMNDCRIAADIQLHGREATYRNL